jgi:hypothetical protein
MSSPGRWALALGILITASVLGVWGCCTVKWCDPQEERIVTVKEKDAKADEYYETAISKMKHQQIVWKLSSGSTWTHVAIRLAGQPPPFVACEVSGDLCNIPCRNHVCLSGSINPALNPPPSLKYGYVFSSAGATSSDPGIRIDP